MAHSGSEAGRRIHRAATAAAAANRTVHTTIDVRYPTAKTAGAVSASPVIPATTGTAAMARRDPVRATALLNPEPTPAWEVGSADNAAAVKGATIVASPSPKTMTAGRTSFR